MHIDDSQQEKLRSLLSERGRAVNEGLIAYQSNKPQPPNSHVPTTIDPSLPQDARLKLFLQLIHSRMKMIREGNAAYGVCDLCNQPIAYSDLEYEPWLERHVSCVSTS